MSIALPALLVSWLLSDWNIFQSRLFLPVFSIEYILLLLPHCAFVLWQRGCNNTQHIKRYLNNEPNRKNIQTQTKGSCPQKKNGGRRGIRTPEPVREQIYSLSPLAAWLSARCCVKLFAFMSASWSHLSDLNRRPFAYKASALPAELRWQKNAMTLFMIKENSVNFRG